jgi:hypothetical protein
MITVPTRAAGVEFIEADGEDPGVRLKTKPSARFQARARSLGQGVAITCHARGPLL